MSDDELPKPGAGLRRGGARPGAGRPKKGEERAKAASAPKPAKSAKKPGPGRPKKIIQVADEAPEEQEFLDEVLTRPRRKSPTTLSADEDTLRIIFECAKLFCSQDEIAAVLGCARSTLRNFIYNNDEVRRAWEDGLQHAKVSLRRKQLALADKNAPAAIFLGKNYLGQKDEHHTTTTVNKPASEMTEEQLLEIAMGGQAVPQPAAPRSRKAH